MIFGNPLFLWGLLLGAVPVILHLAGRKKARVLRFPSLKFLVDIDRALARKYKLRQLIILALRVGAITLAAFALSLPRIVSGRFFLGERKSSTVFILDNSFGLQAKRQGIRLFERAKENVASFLKLLESGERFCLYDFKGKSSGFSTNKEKLLEELRARKVRWRKNDLAVACMKAWRSLTSEGSLIKRIIVISDFREFSLPTIANLPAEGSVVAFVLRPDPLSDLAFARLRFREITAERRVVSGEVINAGAEKALGYMTARMGKKEIFRKQISLKTGASSYFEIPLERDQSGVLNCELHCVTDVLPANNRAYLVVPEFKKIPVLILKEGGSRVTELDPSYWLACALGVRGARSSVSVRAVTDFVERDIQNSDIIFCVGLKRLSLEETRLLKDFVLSGGTVLFLPGEDMDFTWYRRQAQGADPLLPAKPAGYKKLEGRRIAWTDLSHPVLKWLYSLNPAPNLGIARFRKVLLFEEILPPSKALMKLEGDIPLLVERPLGKGKVIFSAVAFTPSWSTFPLRASFIPFLDGLISQAAKERSCPNLAFCGESVVLPDKFEGSSIQGPGEEVELKMEKGVLKAGPFETPGIYNVRPPEGFSEIIAVNCRFYERDWRFLGKEEIRKRLNADFVFMDEDPISASKQVLLAERGRELRGLFLILALLCMIAEGILAGRWAQRK